VTHVRLHGAFDLATLDAGWTFGTGKASGFAFGLMIDEGLRRYDIVRPLLLRPREASVAMTERSLCHRCRSHYPVENHEERRLIY
jgi:hypothetical protein